MKRPQLLCQFLLCDIFTMAATLETEVLSNSSIQAGADVNFIDSNGFSYVMVAVGATPDIMKCLLGAGANPMFRIT